MTRRFAGLLVSLMVLVMVFVASGCGGGGGGSTSSGPGTLTLDPPPTFSSSGSSGTTSGSSAPTTDLTSPRSAPGLPSSPPPAIGATKDREPVATRTGTASVSIPLAAGWSFVSFPFATVTSVSGLKYQLYRYDATAGWVAFDPVASPGQVDTRLGYLAYSDSASSFSASGVSNTGEIKSAALGWGWNLVGCPFGTTVYWKNATVTLNGVTRVTEDASSQGTDPSEWWLYQYGLALSSGSFVNEDLTGTGGIPSQSARFVFSWQPMDFNFNYYLPPTGQPQVSSLSATALAVGDTLTINGSNLGTGGQVDIGGNPVPAASITSWTATKIVLTVPASAKSGRVVVLVGKFPSNRVSVTVSGGGGGGGSTATITGTVKSGTTGAALAGAQFLLDNGQSAVTGADGSFTISNVPVPPTTYVAYVTMVGYQTQIGSVTVAAGKTTVLPNITLYAGGGSSSSSSSSSSSGGSSSGGSSYGTMSVTAYSFADGATFWPTKIEVYQYDNTSKRWWNSWYSAANYEYLDCTNALIGKWYTIYITWTDGNGNYRYGTFSRQLNSYYQTEYFYNSWSSAKEKAR